MSGGGFDARRTQNPFYVLGVPTAATRAEVERVGQKVLGLLELSAGARHYETPYGARMRDAVLVRWAVNELRDPDRRVLHELWAELGPHHVFGSEPLRAPALTLLGWSRES